MKVTRLYLSAVIATVAAVAVGMAASPSASLAAMNEPVVTTPTVRSAGEPADRSGPRTVEIVVPRGFDWADAAIGAAGGFAIALLLCGLLALTERGGRRRLIN